MDNKVAIVTGASSGIGKATTLKLLAAGYTVHCAARRMDAMKELETPGARVHPLDLTKPESIDAFVTEVLRQSGRVDLLVNNAGYGAYGAIEEVPMAIARDQMEVNLFGLARMVQLVLPAMRQQRSGRIVNVGSIAGKLWSPLGGWYHASKFALEGLTDCLRNEVRPFGIQVSLIEPGSVKTEWSGIMLDNLRKHSGTGPYRPFIDGVSRMLGRESGTATSDQIAQLIVRAATARSPKARYVAPAVAHVMLRLRWALNDALLDRLFRKVFRIPATID